MQNYLCTCIFWVDEFSYSKCGLYISSQLHLFILQSYQCISFNVYISIYIYIDSMYASHLARITNFICSIEFLIYKVGP